MNQTRTDRESQSDHPRERRLHALAISLVLVGALILVPSSTWFAQAADEATTIPSWHLTGNKGTNPSTNFLGTADSQPLVIRTNNVEALRILAGSGSTSGNVGIGTSSPAFPLDIHGDVNTSTKYDLGGTTVLQTPGLANVFVGQSAGNASTSGTNNTASGASALQNNTTGNYNTSSGYTALYSNTTGTNNTASGAQALYSNTTGCCNVADGGAALYSNTTGFSNTATGVDALEGNSTGGGNTATGLAALFQNSTGTLNTAAGFDALQGNSTGGWNTASGSSALFYNTTGNNNTAVGLSAGAPNLGPNSNTTGSNNTFIGSNAGPGTPTQLTNATAIGANATVSASNALVLGGTGANAVDVGIGTASPHSSLQVVGNYVQLPTITGGAPSAGDCTTSADAGRMVVRTDGPTNLYVCTGAGGWVGK